jgi:RecJ-like exonuclease
MEYISCPNCHGVGRLKGFENCLDCNGTGRVSKKMKDFILYYQEQKKLDAEIEKITKQEVSELQIV